MEHNPNHPKVTVFMAAYNAEEFLRPAMESVLNQTFRDFEFLIVNDGSTDKTQEILESYKDPRIRIIVHETNKNLVISRNDGLRNAKGEYIVIMDADDISVPTRIGKQVAFMDAHPNIGICGSWIRTFGDSSGFTVKYYTDPDDIKASILFDASLANPSVIMRRSVIDKKHLRYNPEHIYCEDYGLWFTASSVTKFANIPKIFLLYRINKKSFTKTFSEENYTVARNLRKSLLTKLGIHPTDDEMRLHGSLFPAKNESTEKFLNKTEKWLLSILPANAKTRVYQPASLDKVVYDRWKMTCWQNTKFGYFVFKKYFTSPLFYIGGKKKYADSAKIFIKCLLKK